MANTTFNPSDKAANVALSGGNLIATCSTIANGGVRSIDRQVSGRYYWEYTINNTLNLGFGVCAANFDISSTFQILQTATYSAVINASSGFLYVNGVSQVAIGAVTAGAVWCFSLDLDARLIWVRIGAAGNWNNSASANPATRVGGVSIPLGAGIPAYAVMGGQASTTGQITANFGDTAFVGEATRPAGFTAGFTAGASIPTNALASQISAEHWLTTNPQAQVTQAFVEHWASVSSGTLQALATQVLLEHWASVASVPVAAGGPMVTMIH